MGLHLRLLPAAPEPVVQLPGGGIEAAGAGARDDALDRMQRNRADLDLLGAPGLEQHAGIDALGLTQPIDVIAIGAAQKNVHRGVSS